ncbi:hypothetical protein BDF21DRAFT_341780 [Thamnidium elegans]|nr:hypothetical protein BDF21DRAFT_341780 [Thamnidium elegans]
MYSPTQQDYNLESDHFTNQGMSGTPHTTVGAVPVVQRNNNRLFNPSQYHQRQNSFGTVASAMSPPSHRNAGMAFSNDNNQQNWFGTSMDSNGSSFGQSPIFHGNNRDLIVSPSTSTSHLDGFTGNEDDEGQQRNLQEMFEKRRRRRESHNAVERRRRDNINERIHDSAPTSSNVMSVSSGQVGANGRAINKGTILKLSVDHIKELREDVGRYQERIRELEQMIESAKRGEMIIDSNTRSNSGHQRVGSIQFRQQFNNLQID